MTSTAVRDGDHYILNGRKTFITNGPDGFYLLSSFSWSRLIQTGGGTTGFRSRNVFRSRNLPLAATRGVADFHIPRRLMLSGGLDFPFGPGKALLREGLASQVLRGWSIRAISSFQDGGARTVTLPGDPVDAGSESSQWPDRIRDANLPSSQRTPARWFDAAAFAPPPDFQYGNSGRGVVEAPGLFNLDISLRRTFLLGETRRFEARLEAFNATNHSNFVVRGQQQTLQYGTSGFGVLAEALPARQVQLALKRSTGSNDRLFFHNVNDSNITDARLLGGLDDDVKVIVKPVLKERIWNPNVERVPLVADELGWFEPSVVALPIDLFFENRKNLLPGVHNEVRKATVRGWISTEISTSCGNLAAYGLIFLLREREA